MQCIWPSAIRASCRSEEAASGSPRDSMAEPEATVPAGAPRPGGHSPAKQRGPDSRIDLDPAWGAAEVHAHICSACHLTDEMRSCVYVTEKLQNRQPRMKCRA